MTKISKTTKTSGKTKLVFFGSGPVAAASLRLLLVNFEIEAVITKPSTLHEMSSIVDAIPVHAVQNKAELDELIAKSSFESRLAILIDFGIIVSQEVIDSFPLGIVNSHFSLLPEWRGADPITFAILSGQETTGVSLMLLVDKMDEGPLIAYSEYELDPQVTTPELTNDLIEISNELLKNTLLGYVSGEIEPQPQTITKRSVSYSRKLTKDDGIIYWQKPAEQIEREIRAYIEWPKSRTLFAGLDVVITASKVANFQIESCGKLWVENKQLFVSCGKDSLQILRLKPAGKRDMTAEAFIAGYGKRLPL